MGLFLLKPLLLLLRSAQHPDLSDYSVALTAKMVGDKGGVMLRLNEVRARTCIPSADELYMRLCPGGHPWIMVALPRTNIDEPGTVDLCAWHASSFRILTFPSLV
jgi:hypothetical protein